MKLKSWNSLISAITSEYYVLYLQLVLNYVPGMHHTISPRLIGFGWALVGIPVMKPN